MYVINGIMVDSTALLAIFEYLVSFWIFKYYNKDLQWFDEFENFMRFWQRILRIHQLKSVGILVDFSISFLKLQA